MAIMADMEHAENKSPTMIRRFRESLFRMKAWIESYADKPYALQALFFLALIEASVFPIPPDVLLIAIAVLARKKAIPAAIWCTAGSAIGGMIGYGIGFGFMSSIGNAIVEFYHAEAAWAKVVAAYQGEFGIWFLAAAAFTPIPFKVATIAAGATGMAFIPFLVVSTFGRALRFFLIAGLLYFAGEPVRKFLDRNFDKLSILFLILLVGGFAVIKYL